MSTSLFLLIGEPFLRERKLAEISAKIAGSPVSRLYHSTDFDASKFIEETLTFPFLAAKQILILRDAEKLPKGDKESLASGLSRIPSFSTVVLEVAEIGKTDPLGEWVAAQKGTIYELFDLKREEKAQFVRSMLKREGKSIDDEALGLLMEKTGGNIGLMTESIEKLLLHSKDQAVIGAYAVNFLGEEGSSFNGFDLVNAFAKKSSAQALKIFREVYEQSDPVEIIGILNWHLKRLWQAQGMLEEGKSPNDVGRTLRIPNYFLDEFMKQARQMGKPRLRKLIEKLFTLDWGIKQGRIEPQAGLELYLIESSA